MSKTRRLKRALLCDVEQDVKVCKRESDDYLKSKHMFGKIDKHPAWGIGEVNSWNTGATTILEET